MTNLSFAMLSQNARRGYFIVTVDLENMRRVGALLCELSSDPPTFKTTLNIYHQSSPEATIHSHRNKTKQMTMVTIATFTIKTVT